MLIRETCPPFLRRRIAMAIEVAVACQPRAVDNGTGAFRR
jgi:hypothetical protein